MYGKLKFMKYGSLMMDTAIFAQEDLYACVVNKYIIVAVQSSYVVKNSDIIQSYAHLWRGTGHV